MTDPMTDPIMPTYGRIDVSFVKGEGAWLTDDRGKRYLDALTGLAVVGLGHANPAVTATIQAQCQALLHTSNLYRIPNQEALANLLVEVSGMDNMFFGNSGAEANECAIKIARLHGNQRDIETPTVIVADASFHGRTLATLSATGNRKVQAGFEPLVKGFIRVPFNDVEAVRQIAADNKNVVAVMVEPIQGEAGIQVPADDYLKQLRQICDDNGWLLILDEIQTGNGRTGTYFCYQQSGILPDVVTLAKGLANGIPIGVCLARGEAAKGSGAGEPRLDFWRRPPCLRGGPDGYRADQGTETGRTRGSAWRTHAHEFPETTGRAEQCDRYSGQGIDDWHRAQCTLRASGRPGT